MVMTACATTFPVKLFPLIVAALPSRNDVDAGAAQSHISRGHEYSGRCKAVNARTERPPSIAEARLSSHVPVFNWLNSETLAA
jgi:hypothetical protein